jgi:hypothetical protein
LFEEMLHAEGLFQQRQPGPHISIPGHQEDTSLWTLGKNVLGQHEAIHVGHRHIGQQQVDRTFEAA